MDPICMRTDIRLVRVLDCVFTMFVEYSRCRLMLKLNNYRILQAFDGQPSRSSDDAASLATATGSDRLTLSTVGCDVYIYLFLGNRRAAPRNLAFLLRTYSVPHQAPAFSAQLSSPNPSHADSIHPVTIARQVRAVGMGVVPLFLCPESFVDMFVVPRLGSPVRHATEIAKGAWLDFKLFCRCIRFGLYTRMYTDPGLHICFAPSYTRQ